MVGTHRDITQGIYKRKDTRVRKVMRRYTFLCLQKLLPSWGKDNKKRLRIGAKPLIFKTMELIILFGTNCAILLANFFMFIIIQKELSYLIRMSELLEDLKKN